MTEYCYKTCPVCGVHYALEKTFNDYRYQGRAAAKDAGWYCPNGHSLVFRETELDEVRRERDRLKQQTARLEDRIIEEQHRAAAYKGHATRITKRAKAGVCPCCNRSFENLRRHMAGQHPEFTPLDVDQGPSPQAKGGHARTLALSKAERRTIAQKAAKARWDRQKGVSIQ